MMVGQEGRGTYGWIGLMAQMCLCVCGMFPWTFRYPRLNSDWPPLRFLDRDRDWTVNKLEVEEARGFRIQDAQGGQVERQA